MHLGDNQGCWPRDGHGDRPRIVAIQRGDGGDLLVDEARFEASGLPRDVRRVPFQSRRASPRAADRSWHHQVNLTSRRNPCDRARGHPRPDALTAMETRCGHRGQNVRDGEDETGIQGEVSVARELGDRQLDAAGIELDRMGADEDRRVALSAESHERGEQNAAGCHIQRIRHARLTHGRASSPSTLPPR